VPSAQPTLVNVSNSLPGRVTVTLDVQVDQLPFLLQQLLVESGSALPLAASTSGSHVWDAVASPQNAISEYGKIFSKTTGGEAWNCAAIASQPATSFTIEILSCPATCRIMVGFANK